MWSTLGSWFSNLGGSIASAFNQTVDGVINVVSGIGSWISDIFSAISTGFSSVLNWFESVPSMLSDGLDYLFNPNSDQLGDDTLDSTFDATVASKFAFVPRMQSMLGNLGKSPAAIKWTANIFGREFTIIDGSALNEFVPYLRLGLSILFWVLTFLACFRLISSVFGMGLGKASSVVASASIRDGGGQT